MHCLKNTINHKTHYIFFSADTQKKLEINVAGLQKTYSNIKKEVQALKEKIKCANDIKLDLEKLKTSQDYMPDAEITVTQRDLLQKQKAVDDLQAKLSRAEKIKNEMNQKTQSPLFLTDSQIKTAQKKIEMAKDAIKIIQMSENNEDSALLRLNEVLQVQQEARKELECVICLDVPRKDVYSCTEHHILCENCKHQNLLLCPICRQDFMKTPPARNRLAEKMIQKLN